jgi:hypothetical protein
MPISLESEEARLHGEILDRMTRMREMLDKEDVGADISALLREAGERAHRLHMLLKARGLEPKHHGYMIKNRGLAADDPEFYYHFHPVEDLLKFVDDPHANDDPEDITLGAQFTLRIFTRRWGHDEVYHFARTATGWNFDFHGSSGPCDKTGNPVLFSNLNHDSVFYPEGLGGWFEWLWNKAEQNGLTQAQVQQGFDDLGNWIRLTEQNVPSGPIWQGYA